MSEEICRYTIPIDYHYTCKCGYKGESREIKQYGYAPVVDFRIFKAAKCPDCGAMLFPHLKIEYS